MLCMVRSHRVTLRGWGRARAPGEQFWDQPRTDKVSACLSEVRVELRFGGNRCT
jgi:hypothetical protein